MNKSQLLLLLPLVWSLSIGEAHAQCDPDNAIENCSANDLLELGERAREALQAEEKEMVDDTVETTEEKVVNTNRATTAPDPFAARLHASYQDFLVPLSFAISSIEESKDGRALIVRLNPFRDPPFVAGFTVTASKPSLDTRIDEAIPEDSRDSEVKRLEDDLDELGDLTFSGSVAAETGENKCAAGKERCWGRDPKAYRHLLSSALVPLMPPPSSEEANAVFIELGRLLRAANERFDFNTKLSEVPPDKRGAIIDAARKLVVVDLRDREIYLKLLDDLGIEHLAALIDNQPQFSLTGTWHERDETAGPTEGAATLELQFGRHNLNSLKRHCTTSLSDCLRDKLRAIDSGDSDLNDKFVFTASYKAVNRYKLTGDDIDIPGFTAIDAPRTRELSLKGQWGWRLKVAIANQPARFDVSAEGVRLSANGVQTKKDVIGTATLTLPVASNMSIPISLKYGSRPDLIKDVRDRWGAHIGISYRLPWELSGQ